MNGLRFYGPVQTPLSTGGAGVAEAQIDTTIHIKGWLVAIFIELIGTPPATTKVVVKTKGVNVPEFVILTLDNITEGGWYFPRVLINDVLGADITGQYTRIPIDDAINITLSETDDDVSVKATLFLE